MAGEAISGLFGGRRRREVEEALPRDYRVEQPPSGPCAYEIATFLQCASSHDSLTECEAFSEALKNCKKRNGKDIVIIIISPEICRLLDIEFLQIKVRESDRSSAIRIQRVH